jgi:hypothetical protein
MVVSRFSSRIGGLTRREGRSQRFYSMAAEIGSERSAQRGSRHAKVAADGCVQVTRCLSCRPGLRRSGDLFSNYSDKRLIARKSCA